MSVHIKDLKTIQINYRPISLLPIFAKIFEKIIFASMFEYFIENKLFTVCQSDFLSDDSCTSQVLCIIQEIWNSFDESPPIDVRCIFLDISKVFYKVWHKEFVYSETLSSRHLRVLKDLTVIERYPLSGGNFKNRLSHLELNVLSAIQGMPLFGMSAIGRFHYINADFVDFLLTLNLLKIT